MPILEQPYVRLPWRGPSRASASRTSPFHPNDRSDRSLWPVWPPHAGGAASSIFSRRAIVRDRVLAPNMRQHIHPLWFASLLNCVPELSLCSKIPFWCSIILEFMNYAKSWLNYPLLLFDGNHYICGRGFIFHRFLCGCRATAGRTGSCSWCTSSCSLPPLEIIPFSNLEFQTNKKYLK